MSVYKRPPWYVRHVIGPIMEFIVGTLGISVRGGHVLTVAGRTTGTPRSVPVYPMPINGQRYLVSPRGETDWVRNLRAAGTGELRSGRRRDRFVATEIVDAEKPPILRDYLNRWYLEAGSEFDVPKTATLGDLATIAHRLPVFRLEPIQG